MFGIPEAIFLCLLAIYLLSALGNLINYINNYISTSSRMSSPPRNVMARGGRARIPFRRIQPFATRPDRSPEHSNTHDPTSKDCAVVKGILAKASNFPAELVDIVMDFAGYWACSVASIDYTVTASQQHTIRGQSDEDQMLVSP
jgi:hypothetical protein